MTFGFESSVDLLSWTISLLLALKVIATFVLLGRDRGTWFASRTGVFLWWSSKIVPLLAVLCMILLAILTGRMAEAWAYGGLMAFVLIAVPLAIWSRFRPGKSSAAQVRSIPN